MNACCYRLGSSIRRSALLLAGAASLAGIASCERAPEGQVVAVVNGEEVTTEELNGELPPQVNSGEGDNATRNAALDRVVERLVLAGAAREQGIDSSPEYILREKKLRESLLVQMLNEKIAREIRDASAQDIDKMIAENPQAFSGRTVYALDQLVFQTPKRPGVIQALEPTKTMDEVAAVLNRAGIKFQRGRTTVDSVTLAPQMFAQFQKVGTSEPMIIAAGPSVTVAKILAARAAPITGSAARPLAGTGYRRQETQKRLKELLKAGRSTAEITYQSGYGALSSGETAAPTAPARP